MRKFVERFGECGWPFIVTSAIGMLYVYYIGAADWFVTLMNIMFSIGGIFVTLKWSYELLDDIEEERREIEERVE